MDESYSREHLQSFAANKPPTASFVNKNLGDKIVNAHNFFNGEEYPSDRKYAINGQDDDVESECGLEFDSP